MEHPIVSLKKRARSEFEGSSTSTSTSTDTLSREYHIGELINIALKDPETAKESAYVLFKLAYDNKLHHLAIMMEPYLSGDQRLWFAEMYFDLGQSENGFRVLDEFNDILNKLMI